MTQPPRISVILPVFNAESHLVESIKSVLNQSYNDFELIIINDGSSDGSQKIIEKFAKDDSRIKQVNHKKNLGLIDSLNEGLARAKGEFIARQDADDISASNRFLEQVKYLEAHVDIGVLGSNYIVMDDGGRDRWTTNVFTHPDDIKLGLVFSNQMGHGSVMIRKTSLGNARFDKKYKSAEDYDLWARLSKTTRIANLKEPLYSWRSHKNSITSKDNIEMDDMRFKIRDREFQALKNGYTGYKLFSFHPFSIRNGLVSYLKKKNGLCRDLALLYGLSNQRVLAVVSLLLGIILSPLQSNNYRQLFFTLFYKSKLSTIKHEYV